ncbi:MAG: hypothetical protein GC161_10100 [Planctomycetaceae bacterium]|nr:hypothetical protein [Planctomycetaceae bacterium]
MKALPGPSRRAPVALLVAAAVGLGVVFALLGLQRSRSSEARAARAAALDPSGAVLPRGAAAAGDAARGQDGEAGTGSRSVRTELAVSPIVPAAPAGEFHTVRVVAGMPPRPVAGAAVRLLAHRPAESRAGRVRLPVARHRQLEALATSTSDAEGLASFPEDPEAVAVDAEADGLWGRLELADHKAEDGPLVLTIEPDRSVLVRVIDRSSGRPVPGVEVQLNYYYDETTLAERCDAGVSDADGRVRMERLGQHMTWFWPHIEFLAVEPAAGMDDGARVKLEFRHLHNDVELPVGAFTGLHVRMLAKDGTPFVGDGTVTVYGYAPSEDGSPGDDIRGDGVEAELRDGGARFPQLSPGARVAVVVVPTSAPGVDLAEVVLAGAGEQREVTLQLAADAAQWRVRLAASDGADLGGALVRPASGPGLTVPKDGSALRITPHSAGVAEAGQGSIPIECWLGVRGWHGVVHAPTAAARAEVVPGAGATWDLGTVVLDPLPVSVEGAAVDAGGAGVGGVRVSEEWSNESGHRVGIRHTTTDASGRFLFSHSRFTEPVQTERRSMRLRVHHPEFHSQQIADVAPGSRGLRIQLVASGRIEGTVLMDELWLRDFVEVQAHSETTSREVLGSIHATGKLAIGELATGLYTVTLRMGSESAPLHRVERVSVVAGEVTRDPRLQELDLRGRACWIGISLCDAEGAPVADGWARARVDPADEWGPVEYGEDSGVVHIFSRAAPAELFVGAEGFTSRLVAAPRDGERVVLERARTVALHWENVEGQLPPGVLVQVKCLSLGPGRPPMALYPSMSLDPNEPEPEPWDGGTELEATVVLTLEGDPEQRHVLPARRFEVPLDAATTAIGIPFPIAEARAFAERVAPR